MMAAHRNFGITPRHEFDTTSEPLPGWFNDPRLHKYPASESSHDTGDIRPARISRPSLAARRPAFPIVYAVAGGAIAGIAIVLLALLCFLPRSEATAPVRSLPPAGPAHFLGKADRLAMVRP